MPISLADGSIIFQAARSLQDSLSILFALLTFRSSGPSSSSRESSLCNPLLDPDRDGDRRQPFPFADHVDDDPAVLPLSGIFDFGRREPLPAESTLDRQSQDHIIPLALIDLAVFVQTAMQTSGRLEFGDQEENFSSKAKWAAVDDRPHAHDAASRWAAAASVEASSGPATPPLRDRNTAAPTRPASFKVSLPFKTCFADASRLNIVCRAGW